MSIKNLRELRVNKNDRITLEGRFVNLIPVGAPIQVKWTEKHPSPYEDRFAEEYDKGWNIPQNVDAFVRGTRNSKGLSGIDRNFTEISYAIQFYKIN